MAGCAYDISQRQMRAPSACHGHHYHRAASHLPRQRCDRRNLADHRAGHTAAQARCAPHGEHARARKSWLLEYKIYLTTKVIRR